MRRMWTKFLTLIGACIAFLGAATSAQGPAFVQAYLQRLGGHIDEAQRTLSELSGGSTAQLVGDVVARDRLVGAFAGRLAELEASRGAVEKAPALWRPFSLVLNGDREIIVATAGDYTPNMPLDAGSLVYALGGLFFGWAVWALLQWPARASFRHRRLRCKVV